MTRLISFKYEAYCEGKCEHPDCGWTRQGTPQVVKAGARSHAQKMDHNVTVEVINRTRYEGLK